MPQAHPHLRQGFVDALQSNPVLNVQGLVQLEVPVLAPHLSYRGKGQHSTQQHQKMLSTRADSLQQL